jgi:hypothetical protein
MASAYLNTNRLKENKKLEFIITSLITLITSLITRDPTSLGFDRNGPLIWSSSAEKQILLLNAKKNFAGFNYWIYSHITTLVHVIY